MYLGFFPPFFSFGSHGDSPQGGRRTDIRHTVSECFRTINISIMHSKWEKSNRHEENPWNGTWMNRVSKTRVLFLVCTKHTYVPFEKKVRTSCKGNVYFTFFCEHEYRRPYRSNKSDKEVKYRELECYPNRHPGIGVQNADKVQYSVHSKPNHKTTQDVTCKATKV